MYDEESKEKNLFESMGLEIQSSKVEVGKSYPIYGMVTDILENVNSLYVVVNYHIKLKIEKATEDKVNLLRERALDPGIFVVTITEMSEQDEFLEENITIFGDCSTIIYGKRPEVEVQ